MEPERVKMYHISSAQAAQFAQAASEMNDLIESLGPNPLRMPRKTIENPVPPNEKDHNSPPEELEPTIGAGI